MGRLVMAALLLTLSAPRASAAPTWSALALPTRGDAGKIAKRAQAVGAKIAETLGATRAAPQPSLPLGTPIAESHRLKQSGALDEAAALLDRALDEGARAPHRIDDADAFIVGLVRRATIALARGEVAVARTLLGRALRDDPLLELTLLERNPQVQALLTDLRRDPALSSPIDATDLGEACAAVDILIVARHGQRAGETQWVRFDRCRPIARATATSEVDDDAVIAELSQEKFARAVREARGDGRKRKIQGAVLLAVGAALVAPGIYLAVRAAQAHGTVNDGCSVMTPCAGATLADRQTDYAASSASSGVLLPIGVAGVIGGGVLLGVGVRLDREAKPQTIAGRGL